MLRDRSNAPPKQQQQQKKALKPRVQSSRVRKPLQSPSPKKYLPPVAFSVGSRAGRFSSPQMSPIRPAAPIGGGAGRASFSVYSAADSDFDLSAAFNEKNAQEYSSAVPLFAGAESSVQPSPGEAESSTY